MAKRTAPFLQNDEEIEWGFLEVQIIPELVQTLRIDLRAIEATAPKYETGMSLMKYFKQILRAYRMKQRCQEEYVTNITMLNALEAMVCRLRADRVTDVVVAIAKQKSMRGPIMGIHDYTLTWERLESIFEDIDLEVEASRVIEQDQIRYGEKSLNKVGINSCDKEETPEITKTGDREIGVNQAATQEKFESQMEQIMQFINNTEKSPIRETWKILKT